MDSKTRDTLIDNQVKVALEALDSLWLLLGEKYDGEVEGFMTGIVIDILPTARTESRMVIHIEDEYDGRWPAEIDEKVKAAIA